MFGIPSVSFLPFQYLICDFQQPKEIFESRAVVMRLVVEENSEGQGLALDVNIEMDISASARKCCAFDSLCFSKPKTPQTLMEQKNLTRSNIV